VDLGVPPERNDMRHDGPGLIEALCEGCGWGLFDATGLRLARPRRFCFGRGARMRITRRKRRVLWRAYVDGAIDAVNGFEPAYEHMGVDRVDLAARHLGHADAKAGRVQREKNFEAMRVYAHMNA
jgi:hypothetical protein